MALHPSQTLVPVSPYNQSMVYHTFYYPPLNPTHPVAHLEGKQKPRDVERGVERDLLLDNGIEVPEGRQFLILLLLIIVVSIAGALASLVTFRNMPPLPAAPRSNSRYERVTPLALSQDGELRLPGTSISSESGLRQEDSHISRTISLASDEYTVLRFSLPPNAIAEGPGRCSVVVTASELDGVEVHRVLHDAVHPERLELVASDGSDDSSSAAHSASSSTFPCPQGDERGPIWIRVSRSDVPPTKEPMILDVYVVHSVTAS